MEKPTEYSPLGNLVMVLPIEPDAEVGSIIIPESARQRQRAIVNEGYVVDVGPDVRNITVGSQICWAPNTEYRLEHNGRPFVLVNDVNVIMIRPPEKGRKLAN